MMSRLLTRTALFIPKNVAAMHERAAIGNRDIVGFGFNGKLGYVDRPDFPFPAIRFKENTSDIQSLREKEKGDWRKLGMEEKKALYRASFCQTFAEMKAPTGEWKSILGLSFVFVAAGIWMYIAMKVYMYAPLPESFAEDRRQAQLQRMIDLRMNPVTGLASEWDYEKNEWKK